MTNTHGVILIVEDEEDDVFFLKRSFQQAGINNPLHVSENCGDAIDYISGTGAYADRVKSPMPILVLLDLRLPDKSGVEFLKKVRALKIRSMPVIVFTSSTNLADIRAAYDAGATSYVAKPSTDAERKRLATVIKEYWLGYNLFPPG